MESIHDQVREFYEQALRARQKSSDGDRRLLSTALAPDYTKAANTSSPLAMDESFGCGNPLAFAGVRAGDTVLDLGCGGGLDLIIAAEKVGPTGRVIGVDMSAAMLETAKKNVDRAQHVKHTVVDLYQAQVESLPIDANSVDWVISNCVINLAPDKARVFAEIVRVLKPGGHMLIADMVACDLPSWIREHAGLYAACVAGAIDEPAYLEAAQKAGLTGIQTVDRLVYDASALKTLIKTELPIDLTDIGQSLGLDGDTLIDKVLVELEGKVASIKVLGQKSGRT